MGVGAAQGATLDNGNFDMVDDRQGTWAQRTLSNLCDGPGGSWGVFESLPGSNGDSWTATSPGVEIQSNRTLSSIDAHSGCHYAELDSHPSPSDTTITQSFALEAGDYVLSFFYSPRTNHVGSNGIGYEITADGAGSVLVGGVTGPSAVHGTSVGTWTEIRASFSLAAADVLSLSFSAEVDQNTLGGLIDTVSISEVPLPASGLLLLGGLGGIAAVRRRKKS